MICHVLEEPLRTSLTATLFVSFLISSAGWAASSATSSSSTTLSLRDQAIAENQTEGMTQKSATDAQVPSGMLTLKDPRPEVITRTWKLFAGLKAQNFQPRGSVSTDEVGTFDLGANDSTFMPGLVLGVMSPEMKSEYTGAVWFRYGLRGDAAFSSQKTNVTFPSGYTVNDNRLNTTLFAVGPAFSLQASRLSWLAFTFAPQYGTLNYTQTSSNEYARFSKQTAYMALNYGLDFQIGNKWSVFTEYSQRSLRDSHQEIAIQKDNFELGTKVSW